VISCEEAVTRLWDYVERSLPTAEEVQIDEHIAVCRQCCGEADFAGELRGFLTVHAQDTIPPEARGRLETFLTKLDGEDAS
jgi:predicted anti-sigma-YlaC factor YlaD